MVRLVRSLLVSHLVRVRVRVRVGVRVGVGVRVRVRVGVGVRVRVRVRRCSSRTSDGDTGRPSLSPVAKRRASCAEPDGARGAETALGASVRGQRVRGGEPGFGAVRRERGAGRARRVRRLRRLCGAREGRRDRNPARDVPRLPRGG